MTSTGELRITTPTDREIVLTRAFAAPRHLVFAAMTRPELVSRWLLGPPGWTMPVCEIDLRVGGGYRYLWRSSDGQEMGMRGVYLEVEPPARIVATEAFDQAWYPGEAVTTAELAESGGATTLTTTVRYDSRETRDAVLASPMEKGVAASYDRLAELLASPAEAKGNPMLETPRIVQTPAQLTAVVRLTIPREEIRSVMGPGRSELMAAVAAQGITPSGPWFSHHLRMDPRVFDFEIGVPVPRPVSPVGRVTPGRWPAAQAARAVYRGPYEGLGAAWGELDAWLAAAGHTAAPDLWEAYVTGPESGSDPAGWATELTRPLAGGQA